MAQMILKMILNGKPVERRISPGDTLLDVLRGDLGLSGTKKGCGRGECGACTVIMNGKAVNSCIVPAPRAMNARIETIEGIGTVEKLHPLQETFIHCGAIQCGFCTPGMIMSAKALLDKNSNPTREEIKEAVAGNICRCTGYVKIEEAIMMAAEMIKRERRK
ncbi:carbon-monoxide dehydrogenase small subunit [Desulfohalotomaculum tongense]|uniref:(2Fe-2S)-binding protein n=1 Tax=Desulforadius tongensis TaxID=1216062 RepID=UPI00195C7B57|nr:(2Fe-2S)-binding protein [Desulforadius tongensis]MBM7855966.1 carbon-monoxide dehydrogenase small subunit [Desulforadius tongensis]